MLRDLVVCERRAWHDVHADVRDRDEVGSFVQMLWAEGTRHEGVVLSALTGVVVDLRDEDPAVRRERTIVALHGDADHVLGAEIGFGDLLGRPDVLSRVGGRWTAGDVKTGTPFMPDGTRVREEYGVQIGLYALILGALGLGDPGHAFVMGPDGRRTVFDIAVPWGAATMADRVVDLVRQARTVRDGTAVTRGESSAMCGLCHWRSLCRAELEAADDLTLIAELGRALRRSIETVAPTRTGLAALDVEALAQPGGKSAIPGVCLWRLARFRDRARLQLDPRPGGLPYIITTSRITSGDELKQRSGLSGLRGRGMRRT